MAPESTLMPTSTSEVADFSTWGLPQVTTVLSELDCYWQCYIGCSSCQFTITCSPCSVLQLGQSLVFAAQLTSQTVLPFSLASSSWVNQVQTEGHCLPSSSWDCALVSVSPIEPCCWHAVSEMTSVINLDQLTVRPSHLVTVGNRSFASAAAGQKLWNSIPDDITSASSLTVFRRKLKTHLFWQSYPIIIM